MTDGLFLIAFLRPLAAPPLIRMLNAFCGAVVVFRINGVVSVGFRRDLVATCGLHFIFLG